MDAAAPDGKSVSVDNVIAELTDFSDSKIIQAGAGKNRAKAVSDFSDDLRELYPDGKMSFADAQQLKADNKFQFGSGDAMLSSKDVTNKINRAVSGQMDTAVKKLDDNIKNPPKLRQHNQTIDATSAKAAKKAKARSATVQKHKDTLSKYGKFKDDYGTFKSGSKAAFKSMVDDQKNRMPSLTDYIAGSAAAGVGALGSEENGILGGTMGGVGGAFANRMLRRRGNSGMAVAMDNISKKLENLPDRLKKFGDVLIKANERGPGAMIVTHEMLKKRDPEYRKYMEEKK